MKFQEIALKETNSKSFRLTRKKLQTWSINSCPKNSQSNGRTITYVQSEINPRMLQVLWESKTTIRSRMTSKTFKSQLCQVISSVFNKIKTPILTFTCLLTLWRPLLKRREEIWTMKTRTAKEFRTRLTGQSKRTILFLKPQKWPHPKSFKSVLKLKVQLVKIVHWPREAKLEQSWSTTSSLLSAWNKQCLQQL